MVDVTFERFQEEGTREGMLLAEPCCLIGCGDKPHILSSVPAELKTGGGIGVQPESSPKSKGRFGWSLVVDVGAIDDIFDDFFLFT